MAVETGHGQRPARTGAQAAAGPVRLPGRSAGTRRAALLMLSSFQFRMSCHVRQCRPRAASRAGMLTLNNLRKNGCEQFMRSAIVQACFGAAAERVVSRQQPKERDALRGGSGSFERREGGVAQVDWLMPDRVPGCQA